MAIIQSKLQVIFLDLPGSHDLQFLHCLYPAGVRISPVLTCKRCWDSWILWRWTNIWLPKRDGYSRMHEWRCSASTDLIQGWLWVNTLHPWTLADQNLLGTFTCPFFGYPAWSESEPNSVPPPNQDTFCICKTSLNLFLSPSRLRVDTGCTWDQLPAILPSSWWFKLMGGLLLSAISSLHSFPLLSKANSQPPNRIARLVISATFENMFHFGWNHLLYPKYWMLSIFISDTSHCLKSAYSDV